VELIHSGNLAQGFVSGRKSAKGKKHTWICQYYFKGQACRVSSTCEQIARFLGLHKYILLLEKKAIAALIAA
jgi:N-glycosylase/DNA lyase